MITPVDLENKEFKKGFRGYDIDEVETFLTELSKDYARIYRENASLKDKNAILTDAIENYKEMEETMRSAIISAQRTSEEIIKTAHEQSDTIVKEAKVRAQEIMNDMDNRIKELNRECAEIEGRSSLLRAKLKTVLNTYLGMLDELPKEETASITETRRFEEETKVESTQISLKEIDDKFVEKLRELKEKEYFVSLDLKPALTKEALDKRILSDFKENQNKDLVNALDRLLPQKLIRPVIALSHVPERKKVNLVTKEERIRLVSTLKEMPLTVVGTRPLEEGIITRGGVPLSEIDPRTMQSRITPGLFFAGEVLDADALTGGFNLQIAFSTGYLAGKNISREDL